MSSHRPRTKLLPTALACLLLHTAAWAQPSRGPEEPRTWFTLQGLVGQWKMQTRGDSFNSEPGSTISAENELGLPRSRMLPGITFGRRIGQHWHVEVGHTQVRRQGSAVLARDLTVDGSTYLAGSTLHTRMGLSTLGVLGGWSTQVVPGTEVGVLVGGQWVGVSRRLQRAGQPDDETYDERDSAPEFVLGAIAQHALSDSWRLDGRVTASPAGNYQATAGVQWRANRHLYLSAGYRVTRHQLDVESFTLIGWPSRLVVNATIHGPLLTATVAF
jgi:hypothetical protein